MGTAPCIHIKRGIIVLFYVDELIILVEKALLINGLKREQAKKFHHLMIFSKNALSINLQK